MLSVPSGIPRLRIEAERGIITIGEPPLPWCASGQIALPDTQNFRQPTAIFRSIPRVRATGPAILQVWRRTHRMTQRQSSKTLKRDKLQRVVGITFRTETVHKSLFALTGDAVSASAFPCSTTDFR